MQAERGPVAHAIERRIDFQECHVIRALLIGFRQPVERAFPIARAKEDDGARKSADILPLGERIEIRQYIHSILPSAEPGESAAKPAERRRIVPGNRLQSRDCAIELALTDETACQQHVVEGEAASIARV